MNPAPLRIERDGWRLDVVPAVHFRVAFAEEVNRLCSNPGTRPAAVAVELGQDMVTSGAAWLRELGVQPGHRVRMPCMLGIAKTNRRIRASARARAEALQRTSGRDLHQLPPKVLKDLLGYSALSVLYLSPTDSIVEAMRCALELRVPLYGVDLEESAEAHRTEILIEDPATATGRVPLYVARNSRYAEGQRDVEVDHRREVAMAARLKALLTRHRHVLFTGGLAHWSELQRLLTDADLREASLPDVAAAPAPHLQRVVVHPLLAIYQMDVFPSLAESYERLRETADSPGGRTTWEAVDVVQKFSQMLATAYRDRFPLTVSGDQLDRRLEDLEARADFEQLLTNLCLLDQTQVPTLFTALTAAQGTMSSPF